jgi:hypothetical protein
MDMLLNGFANIELSKLGISSEAWGISQTPADAVAFGFHLGCVQASLICLRRASAKGPKAANLLALQWRGAAFRQARHKLGSFRKESEMRPEHKQLRESISKKVAQHFELDKSPRGAVLRNRQKIEDDMFVDMLVEDMVDKAKKEGFSYYDEEKFRVLAKAHLKVVKKEEKALSQEKIL